MNYKSLLIACLSSMLAFPVMATQSVAAEDLVGQPLGEYGEVGPYHDCGGCDPMEVAPGLSVWAKGTYDDGITPIAVFLVDNDSNRVKGALSIPGQDVVVSLQCTAPGQPENSVIAAGARGAMGSRLVLSSIKHAWRVSADGQFQAIPTDAVECLGALDP